MARHSPISRARRRPALAWLVLATIATGAGAGDAKPLEEPAHLCLGSPIAPALPGEGDVGVGLRSLDANGSTYAALRTDERVLVVTRGRERVVEAPENGEAFRAPIVAGDGVPVAVTTRGRIALLEATGARFLALSVQRSAKPTAIPGSSDVVLGSENGSIRRLVRTGAEPRLMDILGPGDEPVGALAASTERVVYFRLEGVVLSVPLGGGEPRTLSRPARAVRAIRFAGERPFAAIGGAFLPLDGPSPPPSRACPTATEPPDIDSMALTPDGTHVALLAAGVVEVRRLADGARVRTAALAARRPTALGWNEGGDTLLVATAMDARPYAISVTSRIAKRPAEPARPR